MNFSQTKLPNHSFHSNSNDHDSSWARFNLSLPQPLSHGLSSSFSYHKNHQKPHSYSHFRNSIYSSNTTASFTSVNSDSYLGHYPNIYYQTCDKANSYSISQLPNFSKSKFCPQSSSKTDKDRNIKINSCLSLFSCRTFDKNVNSCGKSIQISSTKSRNLKKLYFDKYMPLSQVKQALKKGEVIEGILRINQKNFKDAFITSPDGLMDIYIEDVNDRNRALNGDLVAVVLHPTSKWKIRYEIIQENWKIWEKDIMKIVDKVLACQSHQKVQDNFTDNEQLSSPDSDHFHYNDDIFEMILKFNKTNIFVDQQLNTNDNQIGKVHKIRSKDNCNKLNETKTSNSKIPESDIPPQLPKSLALLSVEDLMRCSFWEQFIQRTGKVKAILEKVHSRIAGGTLLSTKENSKYTFLIPIDSKIPRILIFEKDLPPNFHSCVHKYKDYLFIAQIETWPEHSFFPLGKIIKHLSNRGSIESESTLILMERGIDFGDFDQSAYLGLPSVTESKQYEIPNQEILTRRSFQNECVFTIDPLTARDLDDALSIKKLEKNIFEVGVHIADVSYFVKEGLPCDDIARKRTTSVYLVQKVIPMLPELLSNRLCSLNPGEDKLTFSVVWKMDENGEILDTWIGRSIISSCAKLSYEFAQSLINEPKKNWSKDEFPIIYGLWTPRDISNSVNNLMNIARKLLDKRLKSGALKIDKPKIQFALDSNYSPQGFKSCCRMESNSLVEEFMLLANITVAEKIYKAYPNLALLRRHPPPDKLSQSFHRFYKKCDIENINTSSSKAMAECLAQIDDKFTKQVVSNFFLRSMNMALYFCAGIIESDQFSHFALNVPLYTHFTSPIRRYPDIIVHRLLASSLKYEPLLKDSKEKLQALSKHCNNRKYSARLASESSVKLFLSFYIRTIGSLIEDAVVINVLDRVFEVLILKFDLIFRVYCNQADIDHFELKKDSEETKIVLYWGKNEQIIKILDKIKVKIEIKDSDIYKWAVTVINPCDL